MLLRRAEEDRDRLVIILAGPQEQMKDFLGSNPRLNSLFPVTVTFPSYTAADMMALAQAALTQSDEVLKPEAEAELKRMLADVDQRQLADELGNRRFVRNLLDKAAEARNVRVLANLREPTAEDLVTLEAEDLDHAFRELTFRFRGYSQTPALEEALAELDRMVGLAPVKRQVHEMVAQLRVAQLRDRHGLASRSPIRHFVFAGPPGTGKTTVARILARVLAALGLIVRPEVIDAYRADLVGEYLGATAIKTGRLIDSALGGVLFIHGAHSLYNPDLNSGDAYGAEAMAMLIKRAEDDRNRLVVVLAGGAADMDRFLRGNPRLGSRFSLRIAFHSYSPAELTNIAEMLAGQAGDSFESDALSALAEICSQICTQGRIDEFGNGRFARSLFERACAYRDTRVAQIGEAASPTDLTVVIAQDLMAAYQEITASRHPDEPALSNADQSGPQD